MTPILRDRLIIEYHNAPATTGQQGGARQRSPPAGTPACAASRGRRSRSPGRGTWAPAHKLGGIGRRPARFALVDRVGVGGRWLGRRRGRGACLDLAEEVTGGCSLIRTDGSR